MCSLLYADDFNYAMVKAKKVSAIPCSVYNLSVYIRKLLLRILSLVCMAMIYEACITLVSIVPSVFL